MIGIGGKAVFVAVASVFCSAIILVGIYPYRPDSFIGWAILYMISLPLVIFFEALGEKVFSKRISNKMRQTGRIIYGVIILGILMLLSVSAVSWLEPHLGEWGS